MTAPSFASLLGSMTPSTFAAEHWDRRVATLRGTAAAWVGRVDRARIERAARLAASRAAAEPGLEVHVRSMIARPPASPDDDPWMDVRRITVDAITDALAQGGSVCIHNVCAGDAELARLTVDAKQALSYAGDVGMSAYLSPPGLGLRPHFDAQAVVAIQVEGHKRWWVEAEPCVPAPPTNATLQRDGTTAWTDPSEITEALGPPPPPRALEPVELDPGDAVFVPPGTWHATEALRPSMGLVLYFRPITFAAMLEPIAWEMFKHDPAWRAGPPVAPAARALGEQPPPAARRYLATRLRELATRLEAGADDPAVARTWHRLLTRAEPHNAVLDASPPPPAIERSTPLALDDARLRSAAVEPHGLRLFVGDVELELPLAAVPIVEGALGHRRFVAGDACAWAGGRFEWAALRRLLHTLVECGFLAAPAPR